MDNKIFTNRSFQADIQAQHQTISSCGVGAHHQNGQVEKLIHEIQDQGRTVLCMLNKDGQRLSQSTYGHMPTTSVQR